MTDAPITASNPAAGRHRIDAPRPFRYIAPDPDQTLRTAWVAQPVACPACFADTGLILTLDEHQDPAVQITCEAGHLWPEPAIDTAHFITYSRLLSYADPGPDPDLLWITDEGFGIEPPEPIDHVGELRAGYTYAAKWIGRRAKAQAKAAIRRPLHRAKKRAVNAAHAPLAAALRTAWTWQAGGTPAADTEPTATTGEPGPKTPSYAKYRNALGTPAPAKGPNCLVCEDSGRIPGTPITCTECRSSSGAATAAPPQLANSGVVNHDQVVRDVVNDGPSEHAARHTAQIQDAIDSAPPAARHTGVSSTGRISNVQNNTN